MSTILDTHAVSPADRPAYWSAGIAEHFFPMRVASFSAASFDARLTGGDVGPLIARSISGDAHRVVRTRRMIACDDPEALLLYFVRRGACRIEQEGRTCQLGAGEIAVQHSSRPSSFEALAGFEVLVLSFPRWFVGARADIIAAHAATPAVSRGSALMQLAAPMLARVDGMAGTGTLGGDRGLAAAEMLLPVLRGLFGGDDGDADDPVLPLLARMHRYALAHLGDPGLGPEELARVHHVSVRYVHKLFAECGGAATWIRDRRLEAAARELKGTSRAVGEIAAACGYRDHASFTRAFRRAHGVTPRELRRTA